MSEEFEGFKPPIKNYFPMPNEWIDICARIDNLAELKVIQYVLRHTWGFREYGITKTISVDEFMYGRKRHDGTRMDNGTGLKSDRSVKDGIKAAIKHGYLIYEVDTSDPARTKKSYTLKLKEPGVVSTPQVISTPLHDENTGVVSTPPIGSIYPPGGYDLPLYQVVSTPRSEKDTLERHLEKDTLERHEGTLAFSENEKQYQHDHSRVEDDWACNNWRGAHKGKTCIDYQAYIDSGEREETPTEPRTPIVTIGATDGQHTASASGNSVDAGSGNDHLELHKGRVADGHPTSDHPPADHRATASVRADEAPEQIAIANTPDGAVAPPTAAVRQSHTTPAREAPSVPTEALSSHERNDGATTVTASEPRPSSKRKGKKATQAPPELSPEVTRFLDDWDSLHKAPLPRTERMIALAQAGIAAKIAPDELKGCRNWLPTTDRPGRPYYRRKGVGLWDVIDKIGEYRSLADMPPETLAPLADKARKNVRDAQYEAALQKTGQPLEQEEVPAWLDFDNYVGNGPEERQRLVERGRELKAQGFCPDL